MNQNQQLMMLPGLQPAELMYIQSLTKDMTENEVQQFIMFYQSKRKDTQNLILMACIGFFGVAGIQRFMIGQTGMGIVYLLTGGLCFIGTIVDLVNIKQLAVQYNQQQAMESANLVRMTCR